MIAHEKTRPGLSESPGRVIRTARGPCRWMISAITDFRARGTIMGLAGLTAVFGMGTGVAPPVWSPRNRPAGGQARRPRPCGRSIRQG